jgi:hypothetical protein
MELQYREHPRWSYQLHHDNLVALAALDPEVGTVPSYCCDAHWLMFDRASWLMGITGSGTLSARGLMATSSNAPTS